MRDNIVNVFTDFKDLPDEVRRACSMPATPRFQLSLQWYENLHEQVFVNETQPRIYVVSDEAGACLGALFCHTASASRALRSLTNFYSLEYGLSGGVALRENDSIVGCLMAFIAKERWHTVELRMLIQDSPFQRVVGDALEAEAFSPDFFFQYENWFRIRRSAAESFEDYYSARSSRTKNTIRRKTNQLKRAHSPRVEVLDSPGPELEQGIQDYTTVYNNSWKKPEPFEAFMPSMIRMAADLGILKLGLIYLDEQPAAAQLWLNEPGRSVIYKLAYDEQFKSLSVGSVLSKDLFEVAFENPDITEIDYGVGSEGYKKEWLDQVRNIVGVEALNQRTLMGRFAIFYRYLKRIGKRLRKPVS